MSEMRLVNANEFIENLENEGADICQEINEFECEWGYSTFVVNKELENTQTIDPETLPIVKELREKLERYEQAENEGRMIISPVAIGQKIYRVFFYKNHVPSHINEETVVGLHLRDDENGRCTKHGEYMITRCNGYSSRIRLKEIGKTVFLIREEAESVLKGKANHE